MRHHSEIISAAQYYSLSRQQWSNAGLSRPGSSSIVDSAKLHYHRPLSSGLVYMTGLASDSESSRLCTTHPWDSSRGLIHKHSFASTTAAASAQQAQRASPLVSEHRPLYGFYAQRSVAAALLPSGASRSAGTGGPGGRRMAKHMSMPVPSGAASRNVSASPVEPEFCDASNGTAAATAAYLASRHARQQSMPQNDDRHNSQQQQQPHPKRKQSYRQSGTTLPLNSQSKWRGSQLPNAVTLESGEVPLGLLPKHSQTNIGSGGDAAKVASNIANIDSKTKSASGGGKWFLSGLFSFGSRRKRSEAQGQIQRIERRVHVLVATGALRVATRAMVPLVTQLCMVVWSTMHSIDVSESTQSKVYAAAILLLSTQGLLDMALYHIFDTQADNSDISLPSSIPLSSYNNIGGSSSSGSKVLNSHPRYHHNQHHQPSLVYLHSDVVYTPRASNDRRPSSNWHHDPYHHHRQHYYQQQQQAQQPQPLPLGLHRLSEDGKRTA
ncbi:hypothetical protein GGI21_004524, partial [Coemansia aciculifera]